jgi:hypothetical protein
MVNKMGEKRRSWLGTTNSGGVGPSHKGIRVCSCVVATMDQTRCLMPGTNITSPIHHALLAALEGHAANARWTCTSSSRRASWIERTWLWGNGSGFEMALIATESVQFGHWGSGKVLSLLPSKRVPLGLSLHLSSISLPFPPLSLSPSLSISLSLSLYLPLPLYISLSLSLSLKLAGWLEQGPPCTPTEPSSLGENQDLSMVPGRRPWRHDSIRVTASHPSSFAALPAHRGPSRSSRRHSPCNLYPV